MHLNLDTDTAISLVRRHFGVDGMTAAIVEHNRSGQISSVEMHGVVTKKGMPYFDHLKCLVMEALYEQELRAKKSLDNADKYKTMQELAAKNESMVDVKC